MKRLFNYYWWQDQLKYRPFFQRVFLLGSLCSRFPGALNIEPTNACNFNCSFCPVKTSGRKVGFINLKLFQKIINEIVAEKRLKVLWLMKDGEPLMHPEIDQLIAYAQKRKAADRIEIYTNGFFLDEKMARRIIASGLDVLTVSLDAVSRDEFQQIKEVDAYDLVVKNIKNFLKLRAQNQSQRPRLAVKMVDFDNSVKIKKFRQKWAGVVDSVIVQPLHDWEGSIKLTKSKSQDQPRYPCNLPWLNPAIFWDGKVVPCCVNFKENELVLGDVSQTTLKKIFQDKRFQALRQAHLNQDFSKFPTCTRCQYWRQLPDMGWWLRRTGA